MAITTLTSIFSTAAIRRPLPLVGLPNLSLCSFSLLQVGLRPFSPFPTTPTIQIDSKELLIIKTRESLLDALTEHIKANHEYDLPEVIALPITGGNFPYLEWIKNSTRD